MSFLRQVNKATLGVAQGRACGENGSLLRIGNFSARDRVRFMTRLIDGAGDFFFFFTIYRSLYMCSCVQKFSDAWDQLFDRMPQTQA